MSEAAPRESNPLVQRVDMLLRHRLESMQQADEEVPVLTEIVDPAAVATPAAPLLDQAAVHALAAELERALLARLDPGLDRAIEQRLARGINALLEQIAREFRAELAVGLRQTVRDAVAAALSRTRAERDARES